VSYHREDEKAPLPSGTETILFVEDDPSVRKITSRILTELGYNVIEAENGVEGLHSVMQRSDLSNTV